MDSTRKQTEEALRESENYYRTLAQNLPQKIFLKDKNSVYLSCNENYSRDLKMRPAEIAGKTDYDFYPRELAEKYRADDKRIMESGKTEDIEEKYIQDGMEVIIHTVKTPIKDERGKAIGVLGIFWDITERKRADDELKKYRERLEELVEERTAELRNANEQLQQEIAERRRKEEEIQRKTVLLEAINNIFKAALSCRTSVEVARMCLNLAQELTSSKFGFIGEVNEAGCFDTIALSNPGWEKCKMPKADAVVMINNMEIRGIWGRVIKGRESLIVNQPSCHPDRVGVPEGHPPISAFLGIPLEHSGKTFGMIGLANRESGYSSVDQEMIEGLSGAFVEVLMRKRAEEELRKNEEKYRTILESMQDAYFEVDLAGKFTFVNDMVSRHLGYSRGELIGMNYRQYSDETTAKKLHRLYNKLYRTGEPIKGLDLEVIRKDGAKAFNEISASLVRDSEGRPIGFRGVFRDITERKKMEEALREREERYRTLLENMEEGYYEVDLKGRFTFFNDALRKMHGLPKEEMLGMNNRQYMEEAIAQKVYKIFNQVYKTGQPCKVFEWEIIRNDDKKAVVESSIYLVRNAKGEPVAFRGITRDITERKQAEEALRQSEEKYRTILENIEDGYYEVDLAGNFTFFNDSICRILGYSKEELTGMNNRQYTEPENATKVFQAFNRVFRTGERSREFDWEIIRKDGTKRYIEASVSLRKDASGKPVGFRGIVRDITERKQMGEALHEREEQYRTLLETMAEGYYEVDLHGRFTFFNDALREMHGLPKEEMLGMSNRKYMDEETAEKVYKIFNQVYKTGQACKLSQWEIIRRDGKKAVVESPVYLIKNAKGEPVGFRGITHDITERKHAEEALRQSEEKYRNILENIEDGYYEVDLAGNFTFFNDSMCRILGYPKEELMGMNNRQYSDQENAKRVYQAFNRVYRTGEPGRVFNYEIIRKDGTKRHVETSISLRKDSSDKTMGFRGILRDITDRRRIEEQLFQAEKLRAVGEMASGVAHDFNNALAAILGNTQLLLYTAQDGELKETLKIIEQVAKDSSRTVRRLQDFTRRPAPQELFKVDINSIIKDSTEITKPRWKDEAQSRGMGIEIVLNLEDIPLASGNASELREVITNMIFNAVEAMPGGGKVEIRTFKKRKDIYIQISDTGVGIPEDAKKKIFEPFFTTKPFTNTGLGLSMSYGIVKRFGGEVEVESKVGQGTTFTITLPIGEEGKEEEVDQQLIKKGRKARILVIDDEEFVRSVLSRTLAQADHQVTLAEDGRKGVQLFKEGRFDIVLTDLGMPGVSGWEVCRMIKEISPHTPVGMITGWGGEKSRDKMKEFGLDFFISKPFDFAQILNVIGETMESRQE